MLQIFRLDNDGKNGIVYVSTSHESHNRIILHEIYIGEVQNIYRNKDGKSASK